MRRLPYTYTMGWLAALALVATACATARGVELRRVRRSDVRVLPGGGGTPNPLTGLTSYGPQPWQGRRALAVKIGNSPAERPQAGLDRADVVYEELVEGGITRFMAVFLTSSAPRVGPVRSVRTVDPLLAEPLHALFAYSGGVPPIVRELRATPGVTDVGADAAAFAYRRDLARSAPYNLYISTDSLWRGRDGPPPGPLFTFLPSDASASAGGGDVAGHVRFGFASNSPEIAYEWDTSSGRYLRYMGGHPHTLEDGTTLSFTNVVLQFVTVTPGQDVDRNGERSNDIGVVGSGPAVVLRGGRAFRGRWTRSSPGEPIHYVDAQARPIPLAPGTTIVELVPNGRSLYLS